MARAKLVLLLGAGVAFLAAARGAQASVKRENYFSFAVPAKMAAKDLAEKVVGIETMNYAEQYKHLRGIRNNNPGNIEQGDPWRGLAADQTDSRFAVFTKPEYGIRALAKILKNYQRKYGINTVYGIVSRWAPSFENNTAAYARHVADQIGVGTDQEIDVADHLHGLTKAIIKHENGVQPYPDSVINDGVAMA